MEFMNGKIVGTFLGIDRNMLTFFLDIELESGVTVCCGGYRLDAPGKIATYTHEVIKNILNTVGVEKWEDLKGRFVRYVNMDNGTRPIIKNIMNETFFDIGDFYKAYKGVL